MMISWKFHFNNQSQQFLSHKRLYANFTLTIEENFRYSSCLNQTEIFLHKIYSNPTSFKLNQQSFQQLNEPDIIFYLYNKSFKIVSLEFLKQTLKAIRLNIKPFQGIVNFIESIILLNFQQYIFYFPQLLIGYNLFFTENQVKSSNFVYKFLLTIFYCIINNKLNMKLQIGFALLTGLFLSNTEAAIDVKPSGCQLSKVTQQDVFKCPVSGGSGNYDWHFYELPEGWTGVKEQIVAPKGKMQDFKIYGAKIQVLDKKSKQLVKKSLFFSFENGKVKNIIDYKFEFRPEDLVASTVQSIFSTILNLQIVGPTNKDIEKIKQIFNNVTGIGGGCGLLKLRPYFLGKGGLYKGDSTNPYLNKLPTDAEVDKLLASGTATDTRVMIVNVVQSKVNCKDINTWLSKILQKLRTKITSSKGDIDATNQLIVTIQAQIETLKGELGNKQSTAIDTNGFSDQIAALKETLNQATNTENNLKNQVSQTTTNITDLQTQMSTIIDQKKQLQQNDDDKAALASKIDAQITQLQAKLADLNSQKEAINNERAQISQQMADAQGKIDDLNTRINAAQANVGDLNNQIALAGTTITESKAKIGQLESLLNSGISTQQMMKNIQNQLAQLQNNLAAAKTKLTQAQTMYDDFNRNYEEFSYIVDSSYNSCYSTIYNDKNTQFTEDDEGNLVFTDKDSLINYLNKIFNQTGNLKTIDIVITIKDNDLNSSSSSNPQNSNNPLNSSGTTGSSSNSNSGSSNNLGLGSSNSSGGSNSGSGSGSSSNTAGSGSNTSGSAGNSGSSNNSGSPNASSSGNTGSGISGSNNTSNPSSSSGSNTGGLGSNTSGSGSNSSTAINIINKNKQKITLRQLNIFSLKWRKKYGNFLEKLLTNLLGGRIFSNDDFTCQAPGSKSLKSYRGKVTSIQNYYAQVIDDQGKPCVVYFGGCTRIQAVNKVLPQPGDVIYWLGVNKPKGKANQYNAHHCTCI